MLPDSPTLVHVCGRQLFSTNPTKEEQTNLTSSNFLCYNSTLGGKFYYILLTCSDAQSGPVRTEGALLIEVTLSSTGIIVLGSVGVYVSRSTGIRLLLVLPPIRSRLSTYQIEIKHYF
jgi:hypothetical protein